MGKTDPVICAATAVALNGKIGSYAQAFHDERHGYAQDKSHPQWEAEVIDPMSKFVVSHVQGPWDEALTESEGKKVRASDPGYGAGPYEPPVVYSRFPPHARLPGSGCEMISADWCRFPFHTAQDRDSELAS